MDGTLCGQDAGIKVKARYGKGSGLEQAVVSEVLVYHSLRGKGMFEPGQGDMGHKSLLFRG